MFSHRQKPQELNELKEFINTKIVKKLCAGFDRHSVFLTHSGHVYTRGFNCYGQLGLSDQKDRYRKDGFIMPTKVPNLENIIDIEVGSHHTLCLNEDYHVYAFGRNASGELGLGDCVDRSSPCLIDRLKDYKIISMETNSCMSYFLDDEGNVYSTGRFNDSASSGLGDLSYPVLNPTKIPNLPPIKEIFASSNYVFLLDKKGGVYGFGSNLNGQLGFSEKLIYEPRKLELPPIKQMDGNDEFSVFITESGEVFVCGEKIKLTSFQESTHHQFTKLTLESPAVKVDMGSNNYLLLENGELHIYFRSMNSIRMASELDDFLEFDFEIPDEALKTANWPWLNHHMLFPKDSEITKLIHQKMFESDLEWQTRTSLIATYKNKPELISYIKNLGENVNQEKKPASHSSLIAFSMTKNWQEQKELQIPEDIQSYIDSVKSKTPIHIVKLN